MTDMQKIDFHYNVPDRLRYACLVARTVYRRGLTLAVWTADERRLRELDSLLWRFDDLAFLPHVRQERLDRFSRIIDVVSTKPEELQASRSRFRAYKAAGVELAAYDRRS